MTRFGFAITLGVHLAALAMPSAASAAFPGRNGLIAYSVPGRADRPWVLPPPESLMTVPASGGTPKRVGDGTQASWSSNGRELASVDLYWDSRHPGGLRVSSATGNSSHRVKLTGPGARPGVYLPAWFPGRRELYFFGSQGAPRSGWFRGSLTKANRISPKWIGKTGGALSPNGKRIAFTTVEGRDPNKTVVIYVAALNGTARHVVVRLPSINGQPQSGPERIDWSADGRRLVFDGSGISAGISVVNVDGSGLRKIVSGQLLASAPAWSPDGSRIAFVRVTGTPTQRSRPNELVTMKPDGSDQRVVLTNQKGVDWPDWQPLPSKR
jgi:hypothetical protein